MTKPLQLRVALAICAAVWVSSAYGDEHVGLLIRLKDGTEHRLPGVGADNIRSIEFETSAPTPSESSSVGEPETFDTSRSDDNANVIRVGPDEELKRRAQPPRWPRTEMSSRFKAESIFATPQSGRRMT